jgi:AcrR family transcriptional regulator
MKRLDRRVGRSKRRLKEALLALIDERDYDAITVGDITRRADVGRSTFYVHYTSKEDLLFDGFERALLALAQHEPPRGSRSGFRFSLPLLRHIRAQRRFALATMVHGANARIRKQTLAIFANVVRHELARGSPRRPAGDARMLEAHVHAVAGAFLGLVTWWLTEGIRAAPEAVDQVFQRWW